MLLFLEGDIFPLLKRNHNNPPVNILTIDLINKINEFVIAYLLPYNRYNLAFSQPAQFINPHTVSKDTVYFAHSQRKKALQDLLARILHCHKQKL